MDSMSEIRKIIHLILKLICKKRETGVFVKIFR